MSISLEKLFRPEQVVLNLQARTQDEALNEICHVLAGNEAVRDVEKLLSELRAREKLQSTAAGNGIAFPHARTDSVDQIVIGIGRSERGILFQDATEAVQLIFVIGTPRRMVSDYLVCIGALARLLKKSDLREDLRRAPTALRFVEILQAAASPAS